MRTGSEFKERIALLLCAGCRFIAIPTAEEQRALRLLNEAAGGLATASGKAWGVRQWDAASGWGGEGRSRRPEEAFADIGTAAADVCGVYVFKDLQPFLKSDPVCVRRLRNLVFTLEGTEKCVVLLGTAATLLPELFDEAQVETLPLPGPDELEEMLDGDGVDDGLMDVCLPAVKGLTLSRSKRAVRCARVAAAAGGGEDLAHLVQLEKKQLLAGNEALTYYTPTETTDDIGGLFTFKTWLRRKKLAYTPQARAMGVPPPKGVLLTGISGTGKSLSAKACANELGFPLLKLEVGRLFGPLVGDSERITAQTLGVVDALSPVLWIDEIDKAFGGTDGAQGDSGTSKRVLGQILTYMQERDSETFIIATANDVSSLPAELTRKGRFSENFFVDLGNYDERMETLRIHCRRYLKNFGDIDVKYLAAQSEGYTGAEIEACVIESMYDALEEGRSPRTGDISAALHQTVPLSVSQSEKVEALRQLVREGRFRSAN